MSEKPFSRRSFVKTVGAAVSVAAGGAFAVDRASAASEWQSVESPTSKTLYGVSNTTRGPHAVGSTGDIVARRSNGNWEKVVDVGPAARSNSLRTMAVTDDYKRIWFAGGSGALGCYDVEEGLKYNYSAPNGMTSTWEGISVTGDQGSERVQVFNGSGEVIIGTYDDQNCMVFGSPNKPGGGSRVPAVDFREKATSVGHAVDTSSQVYESRDGGETWENVGIPNSQVGHYDVISYIDSNDQEFVYVASDGGYLYRMNCDCNTWTPIGLGTKRLSCVTHDMNDNLLVSGSSSTIYEKLDDQEWNSVESPVQADFYEAAYGRTTYPDGTETPDVIVGSSGTIIERPPEA
ncbi:hypothetical protein JCM30237_09520 [Halolamina litorea]|uniref:Tat (Twin-arginine translocation) pathway signal sequence n=1 Tax=Halolamina litorea TaxID=1515593 RepID=A0ABD6BVY3_9EURY|nr:hypothetical protein [Halolamina litorea]